MPQGSDVPQAVEVRLNAAPSLPVTFICQGCSLLRLAPSSTEELGGPMFLIPGLSDAREPEAHAQLILKYS